MEVWTWYKKSWVVSVNEVREKVWLPRREWKEYDEIKQDNPKFEDIMKIDWRDFYKQLTDIEHDLYKDL
jgi:hypothetical protein